MPVPASNVAKKGLASQPHHMPGAHLRGYCIKHSPILGMHMILTRMLEDVSATLYPFSRLRDLFRASDRFKNP